MTPICSFCKRPKGDIVGTLIVTDGAGICDACLVLCVDILAKEVVRMRDKPVASASTPKRRRKKVDQGVQGPHSLA